MDLSMLLGAVFLALANGLDDEHRERALDMIDYFSERETFSPAERHILQTMVKMADDVFTESAKRGEAPRNFRDRSNFTLITGGAA